MIHSYHAPANFEQEWHTIGEVMERYFAHKGAKAQPTVYAKIENLEHSFLDTMIKLAALVVVAIAMLSTLCYFMALDREQSMVSQNTQPKFEIKSDFFLQPAFASEQQINKTQLSGNSLHPHYQPAFGLPRRFGLND